MSGADGQGAVLSQSHPSSIVAIFLPSATISNHATACFHLFNGRLRLLRIQKDLAMQAGFFMGINQSQDKLTEIELIVHCALQNNVLSDELSLRSAC